MDVHWLEQTESDVPAENRWLSAREMSFLQGMRFAKRRNDWRLGRWTAKRALAACLNLPSDASALANTEIRAAPSGAPELYLLDQKSYVTISLSHRSGRAMCAVALSGECIGCDLEMIEARSNAFTADYFTVNEQTLVERMPAEKRPLMVTLLWSAKESALKAMHMGLRLDTTRLDVEFVDDLLPLAEQARHPPFVPEGVVDPNWWRPLLVRYSGSQVFRGWWRHANHLVRTVVSALPLHPPIHSDSFGCRQDGRDSSPIRHKS
jgi:4'-phosphopantetheinyl transferase